MVDFEDLIHVMFCGTATEKSSPVVLFFHVKYVFNTNEEKLKAFALFYSTFDFIYYMMNSVSTLPPCYF